MRLRYLPMTAVLAAALLVPSSASAAPHFAKCKFSVQKTIRISAAVKRGLPVRIRCDRDIGVLASLDIAFGTAQDRAWKSRPAGSRAISGGPPRKTTNRRVVFRSMLLPNAGRFLNRYRRTKMRVFVSAENPDRPGWYRDAAPFQIVTFIGRG